MYFVPAHIRLIKRFLFLLVAYSLLRIGFYFYHLNTYKYFRPEEIFESFFLGVRFDLAALSFLNVPILLLALFSSKNSRFLFFERLLFVILNSAGILVSLIDYELFLFVGKRMGIDLFVITDDIWAQLPQLALYYWYFPVLTFLFAFGFYRFDRKFFTLNEKTPRPLVQTLMGGLLLGLGFVAIRGGLQHKSINVQAAFTQGKNELGHLVLNTPYHFLRTLKNKPQEKLKYFPSDEEAIEVILKRRDFRPHVNENGKKNIVLIILESFSSEYFERGYMPFLNELKSKSLFFPYHLANGRRSIEALPSILCGLPSLITEPLSKSIYSGNKFVCMPKILKEHGYTNYFFHGGSKGTMGFESYTLASGFDRYYSQEDYPSKDHHDGTWGIYDGPFMSFAADEIHKMKQPFLAGIFTLSSHQPYAVPKEFKGKFPKGTLEIHESIGYTDFALKNFFDKIKNEPWFSNTVFFITADHTSKLETKKFQNLVGQYRVPLLIYAPGVEWGEVKTQKVTQHSDIPKTVLHFVGAKGDELPATSVDLLSGDEGYALNFVDGRDYVLVSLQGVLKVSGSFHQYDWETGQMGSEQSSRDPLLQAYLQYFMNGLINNNLSIYQ